MWAGALCMAAIACSMFQMLVPKEGIGRVMRLLTAAFFLCAILSPLLSLKSLMDLRLETLPREQQNDLLAERVADQLEQQLSQVILRECRKALEPYPFEVKKVETKVDRMEDGSIYISHIRVFLDKQQMGSRITVGKLLEQRLGREVEVVAEDME